MNLLSRYFGWLQKGNPAGRIDPLPVVDSNGETSVPGLYVLGDLTGVPLLKLASESGKRFVDHLAADARLAQSRSAAPGDMLDLLIVGAGPAGISTGIEALARDLRFVILESSHPFSTITNFPKGKPIFAEPEHIEATARLRIPNGTKESLLEDLEEQLAGVDLPIVEGEHVEEIVRQGDHFIVRSRSDEGIREYRALRVALAIGRSGSARMLGIPGEDLPKVYNRLIDPFEHRGEKILVVGAGDSAAETAIALAGSGNQVTLCYRGADLARAREGNRLAVEELARTGSIRLLPQSQPIAITGKDVRIAMADGELFIDNDAVYVMIGREAPLALLRRSGVQIQGEWNPQRWALLAYGILFACVVYFGKKSSAWEISGADGSSAGGIGRLLSPSFWGGFLAIPSRIIERFGDTASYGWYGWRDLTVDMAAWTSSLLFLAGSIGVIIWMIRRRKSWLTGGWQTFKYLYFAAAAVLFLVAFLGGKYAGLKLAGMEPGFWYTFLYSLTILVFGLRRMHRTPTRYIRLQTWTLILVQMIPLFILPEIVLPALWKGGVIARDSWIVTNVFPIQSWNNEPSFWRSYGFILAWPLFIYNLFDSNPTLFWIILSSVQTFVIIPLIVWKWGKGAYCGWICSCGGLAETLGDEYRTEAPHGPTAKRWENIGQWILAFIFLLTAAKLMTVLFGASVPFLNLESYTSQGERFYSIAIDLIFAGVLGLGVYFFLSGRIWCRFGCPLAALMHIYARFTKYRIFADKKKCISCNICTTACHMGIDVMSYANKGIPMNDVECVRCSACIVSCPMDVLSFGELPKSDPDNRLYLELPIIQRPVEDWSRGRM